MKTDGWRCASTALRRRYWNAFWRHCSVSFLFLLSLGDLEKASTLEETVGTQ